MNLPNETVANVPIIYPGNFSLVSAVASFLRVSPNPEGVLLMENPDPFRCTNTSVLCEGHRHLAYPWRRGRCNLWASGANVSTYTAWPPVTFLYLCMFESTCYKGCPWKFLQSWGKQLNYELLQKKQISVTFLGSLVKNINNWVIY